MKRTIWLMAILTAVSVLSALGGAIPVSANLTNTDLISNNQSGLSVNYSVGTLHHSDVNTPQGNFTEISIEGYTFTNKPVFPSYPSCVKSSAFPWMPM
jgi:hypothetical protein